MLTTTLADFRKDPTAYLDAVLRNFETLIVNRGKDDGVVMMSLQEYNALMATQHELSSRKNSARLDAAIAKLNAKTSFSKGLIEE